MTTDHAAAELNADRLAAVAPADTLSPADRYQELFVAVQKGRVFPDSKTFVDSVPLADPEDILAHYRLECSNEGFDLPAFVKQHFRPEKPPANEYISDPDRTLAQHIDHLWDVLTREPRKHPPKSSLLPLPNAYVVPGGRFAEMYYWDSYFTMLGLAASGRRDLVHAMTQNFAYLIDTYGHVPNGTRTYYLSRSQPPLFALMVELCEESGVDGIMEYLPRLRREHAFWMDGAEELKPSEAHRHCVCLPDGSLLNRYWDDRDLPREEAFLEDVTTAAQSTRPAHVVYRELRAAAASGWDFSSRWCTDNGGLPSIRTTSIIPVDLNSFLFTLEGMIARLSAQNGDETTAVRFEALRDARAKAIHHWLWSESEGVFLDFDWELDRPRPGLTLAAATPLFTGLTGANRAARATAAIRERLLTHGGLATTEFESGEQWDRPNAWAPLHWMAIHGFRRYGQPRLAHNIAHRWLDTVGSHFEREGKLVEKYRIGEPAGPGAPASGGGGGGEYPLQDGFGWTNGVTRRLLWHEPNDPAHGARGRLRAIPHRPAN